MEIIKDDAFRKLIKKGLSGGYLFYGEEDYMKAHTLKLAREAVCPDMTFALFNDVRLDALDYTPDALVNALMPPPMMADFKIVSVSGLSIDSMRSNEVDELCDALQALKEYDYNVFILSVPSGEIDEGTPKRPSNAIAKLSEHLTPVQFESISGARLVSWVGKHFEHNGVRATPDVCSYLIEYSGRSMFTLASETEKLSYYVLQNGRNEVTREDVKNVAISVMEAAAFDFTNAILAGKSEEALNVLSVLKFQRKEPIIILSDVSQVICDLIAIKPLAERGMPYSEMIRALNTKTLKNEYRVKLYANAAATKNMQKLKEALALCGEADAALKSFSSSSEYDVIEKLICSL